MNSKLPTEHNLFKASFQLIVAGFFFSLLAVFIKYSSGSTQSLHTVTFYRNLFALFFFIPIIVYSKTSLLTEALSFHFLRSTIGLIGMYSYFYAIAEIPLGQATILKFSGPIFVPILGYFFLKESLRKHIISSILIGFLGVVLVVGPQVGGAELLPSLSGLLSSLAGASVVVLIRRMSVSEPSLRTAFYFAFFGSIFSFFPYYLSGFEMPSNQTFLFLLGAGFCACIGQIYMTKAYANARAGSLAPYTYLSVIFSAILGFLIWNEIPPTLSFIGGAIILIGIITVNKDSSRGITVHRLGG